MTATEFAQSFDMTDIGDVFHAAQGLFWFCCDYHEGQGSDRYRILCELGYKAGVLEHGPEEDSLAVDIYQSLVARILEPQDLLEWIQGWLAKDEV